MPAFKPYSIHHLQLSAIDRFVIPEDNAYLVFWWNKVPLGHLWVRAGVYGQSSGVHSGLGPADVQSFRQPPSLVNAISKKLEPVLQYYLGRQEIVPVPGILQGFLAAGEFSRLHTWLDEFLLVSPDKPGRSYEKISSENLTVVVCTRNRPTAIEQCVNALLLSVDQGFELIVVDNAPDDDSTQRLLGRFPSVRYIREPRKGLDIARNTGARLASHALIAYTDDDVLVDPHWIANIKSCFHDPQVLAVTGLVIPQSLKTRSQYIFESSWGFNRGYLPRLFDHQYFLENRASGVPVWDIGAGANMAFRREAFDLIGWFDERLDVGAAGCSGDSELWYRILAEGWNCHYSPHVFVYHQHRESEAALQRQLFSYMRGQVCSLLVQYENYRDKGNLNRLYRGMPKYYLRRIRDRLFKKEDGDIGNLPAELKGCISGWIYYQRNRKRERFPPSPLPPALSHDAIVRSDSLVSVIIPCYNHGNYLPVAIDSVLAQTHPNMEIIVVDDGSSDHTAEVCRNYKVRMQESGRRLDYVKTGRVGVSAARNIGVRYSHGDYIVFLDADDWLYPRAVAINLHYFGVHKELVFVSGAHDRVDVQGNALPGKDPVEKTTDNYWSLLHGNYIAMEATVLYRREVFFRFHFDSRLKGCEDYDLNLAVSRHYPVLGHTEKIAAYRIHGQNTSNNRKMMLETARRVLKKQTTVLKNESEWDAWRRGLRNWEKYYGSGPNPP